MTALKDLRRYDLVGTSHGYDVHYDMEEVDEDGEYYLCSDVESRLEQHNDTLSDLYNEIDKRDQKIAALPKWVSVDERLPKIGLKVEWIRKSDGERVFFAFTQFQKDEGKVGLVFAYWLNNVPPAPEVE